jgi:hypothetical protein
VSENVGFTERCIAQAQHLSGDNLFCQAITDYLLRSGRLAYDFTHKLWLVDHPSQGWQVAIWLPGEPLEDEELAAIAVSQFAKATA